jgi:preprotein translocase subunit SecA
MTVQVRAESVEETAPHTDVQNVQYHHAGYDEVLGESADEEKSGVQPIQSGVKIGRNDLCPCGSGKKYKQCHGKLS